MNLSSDTVAVLKNFSDINQNILVKPGNKVQTISTMKNILAEAEVSEKFEDEFAIYDLPEFLRSVELFEKPELKFNGGGHVKISQNKQSIKYFFADKSVIVSPTKGITMPDKFVTFTITKDNFARLMKGTTTLNLPDVAVKGDGTTIKMISVMMMTLIQFHHQNTFYQSSKHWQKNYIMILYYFKLWNGVKYEPIKWHSCCVKKLLWH